MKLFSGKRYKLYRGLAAVAAFFCAVLIGLEMISEIPDYKAMINDVLGVKTTVVLNADAYAYTSDYNNTKEFLTDRKRIAEQISEEGSVLLKNNGALPLTSSEKNVTVLGSRAYTYDSSGKLRDSTLSVYAGIVGSKTIEQTVTTLTENKLKLPITLERALASEGITINPALKRYYSGKNFPSLVKGSEANGSSGGPFSINEPGISKSDCGDTNTYKDAAFVMIGRSSGEGREYMPGQPGIEKNDGSKSALGLSDDERNLITVADQISDKVIVLLNSAVAMEIDELKNDDRVDAILWIGLPGEYGMNGVARIISGAVSPSGHLSDTYAVDASASPAAQNFGVNAQDGSGSFTWASGSGYTAAFNGHYVVLAEGLYTGYYYYETRYADSVANKGNARSAVGAGRESTGGWSYENEVAYSFGYGLTYTTFKQEIVEGSLVADMDEKTVSIDVKVKNDGNYKAKDVVQLYVQTPYTDYDIAHGVEKAAIQLVGFEKIELEPGAEKTVTVSCDMKYFASYDKTVEHDGVKGGYILENGDYYFAIGNGAHEALNNALCLQGYTEDDLYVEKGSSLNAAGAVVWQPDIEGVDSSLFGRSENGTVIQNQMADIDYNYFVNDTVTYLSRSNWSGTFPKPYVRLATTSGMKKYLDSRVYEFSVGQSDVQFGVDHSEEEDENGEPMANLVIAEMKLAAYDDERWDYLVSEITFDEAWALSPYGGTSCNMFLSVNAPEVWQIDGPNGNVTRPLTTKSQGRYSVSASDPNANYYSCDMPCEPVTAATFNKELIYEQGKSYGEEMLWSGNGMVWAPGMNLHRTPFNSRNHEYYSEDPMLTNLIGRSFIEGGLEKGAILAAKHFAFNTQESFREGLCQFMEEQSARELELRAFQCLGEDARYTNALGNEIGALGMMTSFSRVGVCGINAHTGIMKNILRGEWGYKGLSSTDMVVDGQFFNPQDSVINNVTFMATSNADNLLNSFWPDYKNKTKVKSDPKMCQALYDNMHYYMYAIANSSVLNGYDSTTVVKEVRYGWQTAISATYWVLFGLSIVAGAVAVTCAVVAIVGAVADGSAVPNNGSASDVDPFSQSGETQADAAEADGSSGEYDDTFGDSPPSDDAPPDIPMGADGEKTDGGESEVRHD
ncbi:MAG: glycoside hydrolase family 3 C-terminal domain-containing protein [Clostridiales bacterium]|nr:glycoside hydrolase family 3 C-terminal domain-containing protein [Clostridiales bacterium]